MVLFPGPAAVFERNVPRRADHGAAVPGCRSRRHLVQVPNIAKAALTPLQFSGIVRTELPTPDSNRFIRDDDSPFGEKILDIPEAQAETMVNPDGITDDFWRETMTVIARPVVLHGTVFQFAAQVDNAGF